MCKLAFHVILYVFPRPHPFWIATQLTNAAATTGDILVVAAREILKSIATDEFELDIHHLYASRNFLNQLVPSSNLKNKSQLKPKLHCDRSTNRLSSAIN